MNIRRRWFEWTKTKPALVRVIARKWPYYKLYRLKETGQRGIILSYSEKGTVTCHLWHEEFETYGFNVFGINPKSLEVIEDRSRKLIL
jgi:hypothetical protein